MGGHGRALEILLNCLTENEELDFENTFNDVIDKLGELYERWIAARKDFETLLLCLVADLEFEGIDSSIPGTNLLVDDVISLGLFRHNSASRKIECPLIWIYLMALNSKNHDLKRIARIGIQMTPYHFHIEMLPGGRLWWQNWELFVMSYRALRAEAYSMFPNAVALTELHKGVFWARSRPPAEIVKSVVLTLHQSSAQLDTKNVPAQVPCEDSTVDVTKCSSIIQNAPSADSGDSFCFLHLEDGLILREIHQSKLVGQGKLTSDLMNEEREKAANSEDIFFLFSTFDEVDTNSIPDRTGVVVKSNFVEYFGPFASRAVYLSHTLAPNLNTWSRSQLLVMDIIGAIRADLIIRERDNSKFVSVQDCHVRTKSPAKLLSGCVV